MKIAFAGKGGSGKTTLAAALARTLARDGTRVVAIDADSNPNLGAALGVARDEGARPTALPATLVSRRLDGAGLTEPVATVLERYAIAGPEDVQLLLMGMPQHADEGCMCSAHATVSAVLSELGVLPEVVTVVDLEASPEHLSRGTARHVDAMLLVAEPYYRSLESVRRLAALAAELPIARIGVVANKVRSPADAEAIREFCERHDLELLGEIPWSEAVREADGLGRPAVDHPGGEPVVAALVQTFDRVLTAAAARA